MKKILILFLGVVLTGCNEVHTSDISPEGMETIEVENIEVENIEVTTLDTVPIKTY